MKEVNDELSSLKFEFKKILEFLVCFIKEPVKYITQIPDWNIKSLLMTQVIIATLSGFIAGLLKLNFYRMAFGLILMPIITTLSALLLSTFLYYYFQFLENRMVEFKKIFSLIIIASIPFYLFQILSEYLSFISLIGFSMTSFLMVIGLNDTFKVEKKRAYQIVAFVFFIVLLAWIANNIV